jgi:hypothetical protein
VRLQELGELNKSNDIIGTQNRDPPACSIMPQPTIIPRAPFYFSKQQQISNILSRVRVTTDGVWIGESIY